MVCNHSGYVDVVVGPGFLGRLIAERLISMGRPTVCLARSPGTIPIGGASHIPIIGCDISDGESVRRAREELGKSVKYLFQCASSKGGGVLEYRKVYLNGVRNILSWLRPERIFFLGSTSVYGQKDGGWVTEESPTCPGTERGEILLAAEKEVLGADGVVARLAGLYGPGRSVHLVKVSEQRAVIEEDGSRWINQIHRDDAAAALLHLVGLESPPRIINLSDCTPIQQKELYTMIAQHFGMVVPPNGPSLPRKRGDSNKRVSNRLLLSLGWRPLYPSFETFLSTIPPETAHSPQKAFSVGRRM